MDDQKRMGMLQVALVLFGLACFSLYPLITVWPSGWAWHAGRSDYPLMMVGIYATLGVFLIRAARNPMEHLSLIWFAVWSSVVHALIMAVQAMTQPGQGGHLFGDVPALLFAAAVLAILAPRQRNAS